MENDDKSIGFAYRPISTKDNRVKLLESQIKEFDKQYFNQLNKLNEMNKSKSDPCPNYTTVALAMSIAEDMDERNELEIELSALYTARKILNCMIKEKRTFLKENN